MQQERFLKQVKFFETFIVFTEMLNVDLDCLVRFNGKTLALPKHENIKLNSMNQTRKQLNSYFWVELAFE